MCRDDSLLAAKKAALESAASNVGTFITCNGGGPFVLGQRVTLPDFLLWPFVERMCTVEHYRSYSLPKANSDGSTSGGLAAFDAWCNAMRLNKSVLATKQDPQMFLDGYKAYALGPTA